MPPQSAEGEVPCRKAGALLGSWLTQHKHQSGQVRKVVGVILYAVAFHMAWKLVAP